MIAEQEIYLLNQITKEKDTTFDEFMKNSVLLDYSSLYVLNKLENNFKDKPLIKQLKI